jgi:UDP:flavonoid glycosyltransferase YjiC (YdhE family)
MRISIQTLGTRGDVQPFVALALGLVARGHDVQISAPLQLASLVEGRPIRFAPLPGELLALLDSTQGKAAIAGGRSFTAGLALLNQVRPLMRRLFEEAWAAARTFEPAVVVHHPKALAAPHIAERLGRPAILASPLPGFTPTSAFPTPVLPFASLGPFNRASHRLATASGEALFRETIREFRADTLGLPPKRRSADRGGTLYAYSRHVLPVPADWNDDVLVSGYWFLDDPSWRMPEDLADFLSSGDPPVYVGFGSMPGLDAERLTATVVEALTKTGRRGLLVTGGGALAASAARRDVHVINGAPHDRLLPHVRATIQHGGAGTTAASLRAKVPTIVCPFFGDQPFWARRVEALGVGPPPLDPRSLTAESLAAAIRTTDDPKVRARASSLGDAIREEDGVANAIAYIERVSTNVA